MLLKRKYYYLVAGLPNLIMDANQKNLPFNVLMDEIKELLHPKDWEAVKELFLINDLCLYHNFLTKKNYTPRITTYTTADFEYALEENIPLPEPFQALKAVCDQPDQAAKDMEFEAWKIVLTKSVPSSSFDFIKKWFDFIRQFRNIQAAFLARKLHQPIQEHFVGTEKELDVFTKTNNPDFGLRREMPLGDEIFNALEHENFLEREWKFDTIKWNKAEDLCNMHEFEIDQVLSFLIKTEIMQRWQDLDPVKGSKMFARLIKELTVLQQKETTQNKKED